MKEVGRGVLEGSTRQGGRALWGGGAPLSPGLLEDLLTRTPSLQDHILSEKSRCQRFHSVWTPFDIHFLRNTETDNKTTIWAGPPVNRLVPKVIEKCNKAHNYSKQII